MTNRNLKDRAETLRHEINNRFANGNKHRLKHVEALEIMARCDGARNRHSALLAETALAGTTARPRTQTGPASPIPRHDVVPASAVVAGDRLDLSGEAFAKDRRDAPDLTNAAVVPMRPTEENLAVVGAIDGSIHRFALSLRIGGSRDEAQRALDDFREATLPSKNHGITVWNMVPTDRDAWHQADVEVVADGRSAARRAFECFEDESREEQAAHDVTLGSLGMPRPPTSPIVHLAIEGVGIVGFEADHPMRRLRPSPTIEAEPTRTFGLTLHQVAHATGPRAETMMNAFAKTAPTQSTERIAFGPPTRMAEPTIGGVDPKTSQWRMDATITAADAADAVKRLNRFLATTRPFANWGIAIMPDLNSIAEIAATPEAPRQYAPNDVVRAGATNAGNAHDADTAPVMVDDVRVGDRLDLEGDPFADPKRKNTLLANEFAQVMGVEHERVGSTTTIAISIEGFDTVGFPSGHSVIRRSPDPVKLETTGRTVGLVINSPTTFERDDFLAWLNDPKRNTATWHTKGDIPGEYSDTYVLVDSHYEGDSSDMPEDIWRALCDAVYEAYSNGDPELPNRLDHTVVVRITNLA